MLASFDWAHGGAAAAGAVTWLRATTGISGLITAGNSVLGTAAGGGGAVIFAYDASHQQLIVGRPADNLVTLFKFTHTLYLPLILR